MQIKYLYGSNLPEKLGSSDVPMIVMPSIDVVQARRSADQLVGRAGIDAQLYVIIDDKRRGFVATANDAFERSQAASFAYVAQDAFAGRDWLLKATTRIEHDGGGLLAFNDGKWNGKLAGFGLVKQEWARWNYDGKLFFPGYGAHYADVELSLLAQSDGVFRYDPEAVLVEVDWEKEARSVSVNDRSLYKRRISGGIDGRINDYNLLAMFG